MFYKTHTIKRIDENMELWIRRTEIYKACELAGLTGTYISSQLANDRPLSERHYSQPREIYEKEVANEK